jgi:hypothetical protein
MLNKHCFLAINETPFTAEQLAEVEGMKADYRGGRSKSQILRWKLHQCWEIDNKGFTDFQDYYNSTMDKLIKHFDDKVI